MNLVFDDGICSFDSGTLMEYMLCVDHALSKELTLHAPMLRVFEPISHGFPEKRSQAVLGIGMSYSTR